MTNDNLPEYVRGLLDTAAYTHAPSEVRLVQTHISYVFLADGLVYKTKKPVDFGFINQTTPEARERFCHAEVLLNTRLAPDVYLGVAPVVRRADGSYAVDVPVEGGVEVVEWAVKMRRLPDDRTEFTVIARNLFNQQYIIDAGNTGGAFGIPTFIAGAPRFVTVQVSRRF